MKKRSLLPRTVFVVSVGMLLSPGCARTRTEVQRQSTIQPAQACDLATEIPWITRWLAAWQLTSDSILRVPSVPAPNIVFYDAQCVYTTSEVSAATPAVPGPALDRMHLLWRTALHHDTLITPKSKRLPVQLMSFTDFDKQTGSPFFVMAAPSYWASKGFGAEPGLTAVFIHEFAHTRQIKGLTSIIGPIDDAWKMPFELDDDAVQNRFRSDSAYVAVYRAERDLIYRAANAGTIAEVRTLASQALAMIRARHEKWFVGENEVFSVLDDTFLSLEGAAQWAGHAWLAHPQGGGLTKSAAIARVLGGRRFWAQDEGLGLFLVVDRLMPHWPSLVFREPSIGAITLLERSINDP